MGFNYRCSDKNNCGKRKTFPKKIEAYKIKKHTLCPSCGKDSMKLDLAIKEYNKRNTCNCGGVPYPHRIKSVVGNYRCFERNEIDDFHKDNNCVKVHSKIKKPF